MMSCSKTEAPVPQEEFTTIETATYKVQLPEGITAETAADWFNNLSEEEIKEYLIEDADEAATRSCGTWSSWSGWYGTSGFRCFSFSCPNSQSVSYVNRRRSRVRECSWGTQVETQRDNRITCRPPC